MCGATLGVGLCLSGHRWLFPRRPVPSGRSFGGARFSQALASAGWGHIPVGLFVFFTLLGGLVAASLVSLALPVPMLAAVAGAGALAAPYAAVVSRGRSRQIRNRAVWPDVVDHVVSGVRAGLSLPDSVAHLETVGPETQRAAFGQFAREYRATAHFDSAADHLKTVLADPVADRIIETLRMSREVGGTELTTVLRNLSGYLRQDAAIRTEVEARQSWLVSAARLGVAAPWVVVALLASRPEAAEAYRSAEGSMIIAVGLLVSIFAYRVMRAVGRIPAETRWLA